MNVQPRRHEGHEDDLSGENHFVSFVSFVSFVCFVVSAFRRYFPFGFAGTVVICANS